MGRNHLRVLSSMPGTRLVAVADTDRAAVEAATSGSDAQGFPEPLALFAEADLDAVVIASPTTTHLTLALAALERGVAALVEKPLAATPDEAATLVDAARSSGVPLQVGHIERFNPAVLELGRLLHEGSWLSSVYSITSRRAGPFPARIRDVGVTVDLATHDVDILSWIAGERPVRVYAETAQRIHADHEDLLFGLMAFPSGTVGMLDVDWLTPAKRRQLAVVGELAAAIAHEVRNPLAVIVNAVAGLRRGSLREQDRTTLLDIVEEEAGRLNRLVGDLLRFARPFSISRQAVALTEMANRFNEGGDANVAVEVDATPDAETVWVDPNLFRLVFDNLISNARQAMRDGGTVNVRIRREEGAGEPCVRIEVEDRGHGMPPDVRRRALDPFYTTRPSGTGLGLPIVQRIVEAHGGWLGIESAEGVGTIVTLGVPVARATGEASLASARSLA